MGRDLVDVALVPPIAFVGKDSLLRCAVPAAVAGWQIETVDPAAKPGGLSMALDAAREPMIAYHDASGMLLWARRLGATWARDPIDPGSVVNGSTSMAAVPTGVGVAYVDESTGLLKYAEQTAVGSWNIESVAPVSQSEAYVSLIVDGSTRAISYYDASAGDLRVAERNAGGSWSTSLVDDVGDVGGYSSLVGGPSQGGFGVAYYDFTNGDLRYARSIAGGWLIETVDGAGASVGRFCSAVALAGNPDVQVGIAYYDETNREVKYALEQAGWTTMVLNSEGDAGGSGVTCGGTPVPGDTAGVAFVDRATGDLEYVRIVQGVAAAPLPSAAAAPLRVEWLRAADGAGGRVRFRVPAAGDVRVSLYDTQGRLLAVPLRRVLSEGPAEVRWDGRDEHGAPVRAGVFFVRVETVAAAGSAVAVVLR
jgi:hypothetical protein